MPISIDQFEDDPGEVLDLEPDSQPAQVLAFLATNATKAFTQTELHEATGIPKGSVGVVLSRLDDRGLVRHRGRYWAIAEDDRIASYVAQLAASSASTSDDYYADGE